MAQMAPAITEASASPGSSRKNSVDLFCSSEKLEEDGTSLGVDLALFSQNGLVRLLGEASSTSDIAKTSKNTPIVLKRREELKGKVEMPNGHCNDITGKHCSDPVKVSESEEEKRKQSAVDLSRKTCASTTAARGSTGTDCEEESRNRVSQHPVANLESPKAFLSKRSARAIHRQGRLENQARKLGKRLRRLQARQIDLHVRQQLSGFFGHQRETSQSLTESGNKDASKGGIDVVSDRSAELETERSVNPEPNGCTTTTSVVNQGTIHTASFQSDGRGNGLIRKNESHDFEKKDFSSLSNDEIQMAGSVLGRMSSQVEHLENIGDSDATDVSSGEESESEDGKRFKLKSKRSRTLRKQYHLEEGEVASRWSWLQSQIINVERRVRRFDDIYRGLRASKGSIKLQDPVNASKLQANSVRDGQINSLPSSTGMHSVTNPKTNSVLGRQEDVMLKGVMGECENHLKNGVRRGLLGEDLEEGADEPVKRLCPSLTKAEAKNTLSNQSFTEDVHSHSARTRGSYPTRKRPLVHLSRFQWHAKLGTVPCTCSTPIMPCMLCSKACRTLPVVDQKQLLSEKVAVLDWSFHPTLSFSTDIPLQLHFAALLKKGEFETRTKPSLLRQVVQAVEKKKSPIATNNSRSALAKGAAASILSSAKLRNQKYDRKRTYSSVPNTPKNRVKANDSRVCHTEVPRAKRAAAVSAASQLQKRARSLSLPTVVTPSSASTPATSPSPMSSMSQSMPPSSLSSLLRKKKNSNAFDINNIVIPYSMASTTRVEKLQYKEIPTPSWRVFDVETPQELGSINNVETEDLSDDVFSIRHAICEVQERKRFLGLVKKKRKRTQRQSSELSTPDPSSPSTVPEPQSATPPGTPASTLSVTPTAGGTPSMLSPVEKLQRSFSESHSLPRGSSSAEWTDRNSDAESWPTVVPWPDRQFPLTETEVLSLKLPTPLPTPVSSMPASPAASSTGSPMCSPLASPLPDQASEKEWTVKLVTTDQNSSPSGETGQPRKGIVLKLAKR